MKNASLNKNLNEKLKEKSNYKSPRSRDKIRTKKCQILQAWESGERDIRLIALELISTPSYVASVLQAQGLIQGYQDLYTSSRNALNIYTQDLEERIGFKDMECARRGVAKLEEAYHGLGEMKDRAGQHHFMALSLMMFNRARYSGKISEANLYRDWLIKHLMEVPNRKFNQ
jgi:hypothetical protein